SSLTSPPAATRRLDADHVTGGKVARHLCGHNLPVEQVPAGRSGRTAALAQRRIGSPLADDREAAVLQDAQLAGDAVAAAVTAGAAGATTKPVPLHADWVLQLERLDRRGERVRHRDVHAARPVSRWAGALAAADRLVVREAVVAERDVVHRALSLRRDGHRLPECAHHDVDDA